MFFSELKKIFFSYENDREYFVCNNNNSNIKELHVSFLIIVFCFLLSPRKKIKVKILILKI